MITLIKDYPAAVKLLNGFSGYYAAKQRAYLKAYGTDYDFCRFYGIYNGGLPCGSFMLNNSAMTVCISEMIQTRGGERIFSEIEDFIGIYSPESIECGSEVIPPKGYERGVRTLFSLKGAKEAAGNDCGCFDCSPPLKRVYEVVSQSFGGIDLSLWYTDTSHRLRHGVSEVFLLNGCSAAAVDFEDGKNVYISSVCTLPEKRGRGFGRELITLINNHYEEKGRECLLWAEQSLCGFYRSIGLEPIDRDYYYKKGDKYG
ncbi:MAG: GNAT family N-acetyltransferase [Oscillospiraceae bacterium]|nr:GNAT family N-acetyltransferase [Oscillospiraceae bacterium]